jgi:uncharacterized protein
VNVKGIPPEVTDETTAFWDEAGRDRLVVDRCTQCDGLYFPPRAWCPACASGDWIDPRHRLEGPARLYSYSINETAWLPAMEVPFVLGLAEFDHAPGVRIPCRVRGVGPADGGDLACDALLDVAFEDGPGGFRIPSFVLRPTEDRGVPESAQP